jgi:hypothetical protein
MLPTYEQAYAAAIDNPPFSNGDEGYGWMYHWCDRCINDKGTRDGSNPQGCPLVCVALMGRTPIEWLDQKRVVDGKLQPYSRGGQYQCTYFRDEEDGGGDGEPKPIPDPPGQLTLVPREPYERPARMLTDYPTPVEVSHAAAQ